MLAVAAFVAFWVVVAFGLFFVAARGGLGGARATLQKQSRGTNRFVGVTFTFIAIAFGVGLPLAMLIGNHDNARAAMACGETANQSPRARLPRPRSSLHISI